MSKLEEQLESCMMSAPRRPVYGPVRLLREAEVSKRKTGVGAAVVALWVLVCMAVAQGQTIELSIALGDTNQEDGIHLGSQGDFDTELVVVNGVEARRTGNGQVLPSEDGNEIRDTYMQFSVDDALLFKGEPTPRVQLRVEYYDLGTDNFVIQYDASSTGGAFGDGRFTSTSRVTKVNSGKLKVATFSIDDAYFGNRDNGADFRIDGLGDGPETIRRVAVLLLAEGVDFEEDLSLKYEQVWGTEQAELIVRYGDVDNLGVGWPEGFAPFSGETTPEHDIVWLVDPDDAEGTDRIMVVSSYDGWTGDATDGYTASTSRPSNEPCEILIAYTAPAGGVVSAILQVFADDFQSPVWRSSFQVTINGLRVPELEDVLNALDQTGPVGKLITFPLPRRVVASMQTGELRIFVDDPETGAGDGFAFDFFRLLLNPVEQ